MDKPVAERGVEERVSTLLADRGCARCSFNLVGQSIVRERHYGMLIVRCPECGTVASLQEYPLLGRWANRWAAMAAAAWLLACVVVTIGAAGMIFGFTIGTMELTTQSMTDRIGKMFEAHQLAAGVAQNQLSGWWSIDEKWWATVDKAALVQEAGGLAAIDWKGMLLWVIGLMALVPLCAAWAVAMSHRRGWRLAVTYAPMLVIAAGFFAVTMLEPRWNLNARQLAQDLLWPMVAAGCAVAAVIGIVVGASIGRPAARLLVVMMLPPRLRVPLSFLWLCDGKSPPRARW